MSTVVTGEAVLLELKPASVGTRGLGTLIDAAALVALYVAVFLTTLWVLSRAQSNSGSLLGALALAYYVLIMVVIPVTIETITRGKSLGKLVMGIRVVREDGGAVRFRQALIRCMLWQLEVLSMSGALAALVGLLNPKSKRLGDYLAGTYALRDRTGRTFLQLSVMPPRMAGWAQIADIRSLPDSLARRVSQFLANAPKMNPSSRWQMAAALADEVNGFAAPAPPPGTQPEEFLAAVSTVRRDRDFARLTRQARQMARHDDTIHRLPFAMDTYEHR